MKPSRFAHWFDTSAAMRAPTDGNLADFFITGEEAFADIADRLEYDAGRDAAVYLLAWSFDTNVKMTRDPPTPGLATVGELLANFAKAGGTVRAILWDNTIMPAGGGCPAAKTFIDGLPGGRSRAILDHRTPLAGSHHQKVQIIVPAKSQFRDPPPAKLPAVAYCGGMDLFTDRVGGPAALHDVHAKVRGPAADDLLKVFQERWNDHPDKGGDLTDRTDDTPGRGNAIVQVCCTYPAFQSGTLYALLLNRYLDPLQEALKKAGRPLAGDMRVNGSSRFYSFYSPSSAGVQQIWRAVKKAIGEAKQFIYLEDQYLTFKWVGDALAAKLVSVQDPNFRIIIVALHPDSADQQQMWPRRRAFLDSLKAADPRRQRWTIVSRRGDRPNAYVHSKTWIFDDELVITGSANVDRRGYTYNSEVDVVIAGEVEASAPFTKGATTLAQDLRARLFAKHLGGKPTDYLDPKKALAKWFGRLDGTNVVAFDPAAKIGPPDEIVAKLRALGDPKIDLALNFLPGGAENWLWDNVEDPDSGVPVP